MVSWKIAINNHKRLISTIVTKSLLVIKYQAAPQCNQVMQFSRSCYILTDTSGIFQKLKFTAYDYKILFQFLSNIPNDWLNNNDKELSLLSISIVTEINHIWSHSQWGKENKSANLPDFSTTTVWTKHTTHPCTYHFLINRTSYL